MKSMLKISCDVFKASWNGGCDGQTVQAGTRDPNSSGESLQGLLIVPLQTDWIRFTRPTLVTCLTCISVHCELLRRRRRRQRSAFRNSLRESPSCSRFSTRLPMVAFLLLLSLHTPSTGIIGFVLANVYEFVSFSNSQNRLYIYGNRKAVGMRATGVYSHCTRYFYIIASNFLNIAWGFWLVRLIQSW